MRVVVYNERTEARAVLAHCSIGSGATWEGLTGAQVTALAARRVILRARRVYPVPDGGLREFFEQVTRHAR